MTEISFYWDGAITGDAGPFTFDITSKVWRGLFSRQDNSGILSTFGSELIVEGSTNAVVIGTGVALVFGSFYKNDSALSVTVSTPISNPRIDTIVLQKIWGTQTTRIAKLTGNEAASPTSPTITQNDGSVWEIPLADVSVDTSGNIVVIDKRNFLITPLSEGGALFLIEEQTADGTVTSITFSNIPSKYKHLVLITNAKNSDDTNSTLIIQPNAIVDSDYSSETIWANVVPVAVAQPRIDRKGYQSEVGGLLRSGLTNQVALSFLSFIGATNNAFVNNALHRVGSPPAPSNKVGIDAFIHNTSINAITSIVLTGLNESEKFSLDSKFSLYGIL